jgi:hypothetical protein
MTLQQIAGLGKKLMTFLALFADCFGRREGRGLLAVYVRGQLSELRRKTAESIALKFGAAPRTLQRFLEAIKWDEERLRDRCQQLVATEHAHPEAIGAVDESGVAKSGRHTAGVGRQWNGNQGKVDKREGSGDAWRDIPTCPTNGANRGAAPGSLTRLVHQPDEPAGVGDAGGMFLIRCAWAISASVIRRWPVTHS